MLGGLAVVALGAFFLYRHWKEEQRYITVHFEVAPGQLTGPFKLEVADRDPARIKGLMFRKPAEIPDKGGMFFVFPDEQIRTFWMKNTYTSLDIIFLDKNLKVVGVLSKVPVLNEEPRRIGAPSKYVVELKAGVAAQSGIDTGSVAKLKEPLNSR